MKLNRRGDAFWASPSGVFLNGVSLDVRHGTQGRWRTDTAMVCQLEVTPGVWHIVEFDIAGGGPRTVLERGANWICAGGGNVATGTPAGVSLNADARQWPGAGLCAVSPEGRIVITPQYQVGEGLLVIEPNGIAVVGLVNTGPLASDGDGTKHVQLLGDLLFWVERDGAAYGWDLSTGSAIAIAQRIERINFLVPVLTGNRVRLIERTERLTARNSDGRVGILVEANPTTWVPDAVQREDGRIAIAWANNKDETADSLQRSYVTPAELNAATYDLNAPIKKPDDPPKPIDCVVGAWKPWSAWKVDQGGKTESRTRERAITQPPANGGRACPDTVEQERRPIQPPPPPPPEEPMPKETTLERLTRVCYGVEQVTRLYMAEQLALECIDAVNQAAHREPDEIEAMHFAEAHETGEFRLAGEDAQTSWRDAFANYVRARNARG